MKPILTSLSRGLLILLGLGGGIALAAFLISHARAPQHTDSQAPAPTLSVIELQPVALQIEARGLGTARSAERWQAVTNVAGRVVERHPDLESGNLLPAGTLLLALDPSRYQLAIAETEADAQRLTAERAQLDVEAESTRRLLALEQERLDLTEQELARIEQLAKTGSASRSQLDEQRRASAAQRRAVATLENELSLIPSRRQQLAAQQARAAVLLAQAKQDLADTRFEAPYALRLSEVEVELHQYIAPGQRLFSADSLAAAEVEAQIPLGMLRRLLGSVATAATAPNASNAPNAPIPETQRLDERMDFSAVTAEVRLVGDEQVRWPAELTRVASGLDPVTRSARVVVRVAHPYRDASPPDRPPLQPGMLTQVTLSAASPEPRLVVPASAVHPAAAAVHPAAGVDSAVDSAVDGAVDRKAEADGKQPLLGSDSGAGAGARAGHRTRLVYRLDAEDRLRHTPVEIAFEQSGLAVIAAGLAPGDRVIVDDPLPAIDGMQVNPRPDPALEARLKQEAQRQTARQATPERQVEAQAQPLLRDRPQGQPRSQAPIAAQPAVQTPTQTPQPAQTPSAGATP
jgi:multidrug efflux pump subunit AcrA (membrane-fusion protein)